MTAAPIWWSGHGCPLTCKRRGLPPTRGGAENGAPSPDAYEAGDGLPFAVKAVRLVRSLMVRMYPMRPAPLLVVAGVCFCLRAAVVSEHPGWMSIRSCVWLCELRRSPGIVIPV